MASVRVAIPDEVFSLEYISKNPGPQHASIHLKNAIFLILIDRKLQKQFASTWQKQQSSSTILHIPACSMTTHRDNKHLTVTQDIKLFYIVVFCWLDSEEQE